MTCEICKADIAEYDERAVGYTEHQTYYLCEECR